MAGAELEDVVGAGGAEVGECFVELVLAWFVAVGVVDHVEQALFHDVETGENVFGAIGSEQ
jgi:hypothetical protein